MDELFRQVAFAAQNGVYFLALAGALVIPDICGALGSPDGRTSGPMYVKWFDTYCSERFSPTFFDGETCWRFRCSLLHQGTTQHPMGVYSRVLFIEPGAMPGSTFHMNVLNDALNIDVGRFCMDMVACAIDWQNTVVGSEPYETNLKKSLRRYPNGLAPYIVGMPVIT